MDVCEGTFVQNANWTTGESLPWSYETSSPGGAQAATLKALAAGAREPKTPSYASGHRIYQDGAHPHEEEETEKKSEDISEEDPVALANEKGEAGTQSF